MGISPSAEEANACLLVAGGDDDASNAGVCCPVDNNPNTGQSVQFAAASDGGSGDGSGEGSGGEDVRVDSVSVNDVDSIIGTRHVFEK